MPAKVSNDETISLSVLVMDDDRDIGFIIMAGLHSHGHSVEVFNDPRQALAE